MIILTNMSMTSKRGVVNTVTEISTNAITGYKTSPPGPTSCETVRPHALLLSTETMRDKKLLVR